MGIITPSARGRELGAELRQARELAEINGNDLALMLGWSPSKVSRMESGKRGCTLVDVAVYLTSCGVVGAELERLLDLAAETDDGYWLRPHGAQLPDQLRSLVVQENTANAITDFELARIPGLLQTEEYARALLVGAGIVPSEGVEPRVSARLARQSLLRRRYGPGLRFLIHEQALRLPVGGPRVMLEQVRRLLEVSTLQHCTIRVILASEGAHAGLNGPFRLLEFQENSPAVYVESETASLFLEKATDIATYRTVLGRLTAAALDEGHSREWLARLATEYG